MSTIQQRVVSKFLQGKELEAVAPPEWEETVKKMKKHPEIDNPWALAWYMKNKGDKPHAKTAGAFPREGQVLRKLEEFWVEGGNGGLNVTAYEIKSLPKTASDKSYYSYKLAASMNHFGNTVEVEFPLHNVSVVRALIASLSRLMPLMVATETSYQREAAPKLKIVAGQQVPDDSQGGYYSYGRGAK